MKNIVVLIGSPRKNGNTDILAKSFIEGAESAGNSVTTIYVRELNIHSCIGCNGCYRSETNKCVFDDDMVKCYEILSKADVIVTATPIYFYGVSSQLKCLIDRLHNPIRNNFKVKKLAFLGVCADTIDTVFDSAMTMYNSILRYFSLEDGGSVKVFGVSEKGDILGNPALEEAIELGRSI